MAKNLAYYIDLLEQSVGGRIDSRQDKVQLINDAGEYLCSMHPWKFLYRPPADLDFVADQAYITTAEGLPSDVREVIHIDVPNSLDTTVQLASLKEVLYFRGSALDDPFRYYAALVFTDQSSTTVTQQPRLELWPTPNTNTSGALKLEYRAGWTVMDDTTDYNSVPNLPLAMEPLFTSLLQVYARGAVDRRKPLHQYLSEFESSSILDNYKKRYGSVQGNLGQPVGGHIPYDAGAIYRPHRTITRNS